MRDDFENLSAQTLFIFKMERQLGYKGSIHWSLLLLEGICKTIAVCSVLSWYGLIRQGKLLRAVIWISVLSGLQGTVDGFTTDMKWTDKSVITDSLELSGRPIYSSVCHRIFEVECWKTKHKPANSCLKLLHKRKIQLIPIKVLCRTK